MDPFRNGAAVVARSASPIGRSLNGSSAKLFRPEGFAELTTITASRYRARASRPSAPLRWLRGFFLVAHPSLLCEEGGPRLLNLSHNTYENHLRLRSFLLGENRVKHGFLDVRLELAGYRVDEGIATAASELLILRCHVVLRRMISNLHITRQRADHFEGS